MSQDTGRGPSPEQIKEWRTQVFESYSSRFEAISDISAKASDEALRFIGLAHLGGIAGCLGFIGAVKHGSPAVGLAIVVFTFGVAALLAAHLARYLALMKSGKRVIRQSEEFAGDPTRETYYRLRDEERLRSESSRDWSLVLAVSSGAAFFVGAAVAGYAAYTEPANQDAAAQSPRAMNLAPAQAAVSAGSQPRAAAK